MVRYVFSTISCFEFIYFLGNTRVVGQEQLQRFQENLGKLMKDPFQVVMRQTRLPISLLQEKSKQQRVHITDTESFEYTFGKKALRKKPKIGAQDLDAFREEIEKKHEGYKEEDDVDLKMNREEQERFENPNPLFRAGQSHRVWGELYKVRTSALKFFDNALFDFLRLLIHRMWLLKSLMLEIQWALDVNMLRNFCVKKSRINTWFW